MTMLRHGTIIDKDGRRGAIRTAGSDAMVTCQSCQKLIPSVAPRCQHCGAPNEVRPMRD